MAIEHLGAIRAVSVKLLTIAMLVLANAAAGPYPKVNLSAGYEPAPAWPDKPEHFAWRYMTGVTVDKQGRVWTLNMNDPPVQVYDRGGAFLFSWGEGQFKAPHYIRIDHEGHVWAADYRRHIVRKFTEEGELLLTLGTADEPGSGETHLNGPTDMVVAPDGSIFVSDGYGNNRVVHFDAQGQYVKEWGGLGVEAGQLSQPHSIAMDSSGRIYVAERNNCRIQIFDQDGKSLDQWRNIINPWGIEITPGDEVIVCGSSPARWTDRGNLGNPPHDQIVMKFDTTGRVLEHWAFPMVEDGEMKSGCLDWVHGLGVDEAGNLYLGDVADNSPAHRVQKFIRVEPDHPAQTAALDYDIQLQTVMEHDDGEFLWFHPRACTVPDQPGHVVMTLQKHLHKSDFYSGIFVMHSYDYGKTWTEPDGRDELAWKPDVDDTIAAVADVTPGWHEATGKVVAIGIKVRYRDGVQVDDRPFSRLAAYTAYDPNDDSWQPWQYIEMPEPEGKFHTVSPGCGQWLVEPNGDILLPFYFSGPVENVNKTTVMRCRFDGETLTYIEHGDELELNEVRGLVEPSLTKYDGTYYLTIRNDNRGYVTTSEDGLHYAPIKPWTFDDGAELGSYNTQQHWITHSSGLFLTYTRRGADNDHIFRHRAPMFIAQVDPDKLHVIRSTERVIIPERGATLGNFGASNITPEESWITVSEGIFTDEARASEATGATFISRIKWHAPNELVKTSAP
jgi:hypothetical protein